MTDFEIVIIGAGVVGLAIARKLALSGKEVLILEKNQTFGAGISSRNSEVVHAGIYYSPGSLKAKHCVVGKRLAYEYCDEKNIPYKKLGKLIVASNISEEPLLKDLFDRSRRNGLIGEEKLKLLNQSQMKSISPEIKCTAALYSPSTGIIDSHNFMQNLLWDAETAGATFSFGTKVHSITRGSSLSIEGMSLKQEFKITARKLVIAAGLETQQLSQHAKLNTPGGYWLKGNYFNLRHAPPFKNLIYPLPSKGGLGTHLTLDLDGRAKFGPDTESIVDEDYTVDPDRLVKFENSIRKYWPGLPSNSLVPGYSGIRPKLLGSNGNEPDFKIYGPKHTGMVGVHALHGIESPGLTSALSLANEVSDNVLGD